MLTLPFVEPVFERNAAKGTRMSTNGLDVFDKTLQTTHIWLDEIIEDLGTDRHTAWHVLGAVMRTLRDRLPPNLSAHLSAENRAAYLALGVDAMIPKPFDVYQLRAVIRQIGNGEATGTETRTAELQASEIFRLLRLALPETEGSTDPVSS